MLFVPGYAALRLVTSYAAPWLRHVRVSLGSLQTWWSVRAANEHAGSNHALRSTVDSRQPVCGDYSASVRFIKIPARFTCDLVDFAMAMLKATALGLEGLKFRNAIATEAGHTGACELIFLKSVAEE